MIPRQRAPQEIPAWLADEYDRALREAVVQSLREAGVPEAVIAEYMIWRTL
jgi:hypothetical protein